MLRDQTKSSIFVHLWNQTLRDKGIQKTLLPPRGSMLRQWADQHPVAGWTGEYDEQSLERSLLLQAYCDTLTFENRQMSAELQTRAQERQAHQALIRESEQLENRLRDHASDIRTQKAEIMLGFDGRRQHDYLA